MPEAGNQSPVKSFRPSKAQEIDRYTTRRFHLFGAAFFLLLALLAEASCSASSAANTQNKKPSADVPVTVATAEKKQMPVQLNAIGSIESTTSVSVKSQVTGQLLSVNFKEGDFVRKGQLLFTLDSRPLVQAVNQAQSALQHDIAAVSQMRSQLSKDTAQEKYASTEAGRYSTLQKEGIVSKEQAEQFVANAGGYEATLDADKSNIDAAQAQVRESQAALENAKVQLSYAQIRSPIDGRAGNLIVTKGNLINANDSAPLVVINSVSPIYANFAVPEKYLGELQKYDSSGNVRVVAEIDENTSRVGKLSSLDNQVSSATGTVQLKASFDNSDNLLFPGRFVNIVLTVTNQPDAVIVPSQAVQVSQQGQYVYVVKPDQTAEMRSIVLDRTVGDMAVIASGLNGDETVIVDGQLRVTPGAAVQATTATPSQQSNSNSATNSAADGV